MPMCAQFRTATDPQNFVDLYRDFLVNNCNWTDNGLFNTWVTNPPGDNPSYYYKLSKGWMNLVWGIERDDGTQNPIRVYLRMVDAFNATANQTSNAHQTWYVGDQFGFDLPELQYTSGSATDDFPLLLTFVGDQSPATNDAGKSNSIYFRTDTGNTFYLSAWNTEVFATITNNMNDPFVEYHAVFIDDGGNINFGDNQWYEKNPKCLRYRTGTSQYDPTMVSTVSAGVVAGRCIIDIPEIVNTMDSDTRSAAVPIYFFTARSDSTSGHEYEIDANRLRSAVYGYSRDMWFATIQDKTSFESFQIGADTYVNLRPTGINSNLDSLAGPLVRITSVIP